MSIVLNGTTGITTPDVTSDGLTVDSTTLVVDEANNRVGIGTSTPSANNIVTISGATPNSKLLLTGGTTQNGLTFGSAGGGNQFYLYSQSGGLAVYDETVGTERMRLTSGGDLQFNSGYGSAATAYGCRAWVNFNGTGTVAIRGSGNVSSITDVDTGRYVMNFTTAMPDANYSAVANATKGGGTETQANSSGIFYREDTVVSTSIECYVMTFSGTMVDRNYVMLSIFR